MLDQVTVSRTDATARATAHASSQVIIILPAYNEAENLEPLVRSFSEVLTSGTFQIVVVDDGSSDGTAKVLEDLTPSNPLHVVTHSVNQGLGRTILDGVRQALQLARPDAVIVTMDADQTHPVTTLLDLAHRVESGFDVAIASRYRRGSQVLGLSLLRQALSYGASILFRTLLPTQGVRDYTCGYRAYHASSLRFALEQYGDDLVGGSGFECMAGILFKFRALGFRFAEVPFLLRYDRKLGASKMRVASTIVSTLKLAAATRGTGHRNNVAPVQRPISNGGS